MQATSSRTSGFTIEACLAGAVAMEAPAVALRQPRLLLRRRRRRQQRQQRLQQEERKTLTTPHADERSIITANSNTSGISRVAPLHNIRRGNADVSAALARAQLPQPPALLH